MPYLQRRGGDEVVIPQTRMAITSIESRTRSRGLLSDIDSPRNNQQACSIPRDLKVSSQSSGSGPAAVARQVEEPHRHVLPNKASARETARVRRVIFLDAVSLRIKEHALCQGPPPVRNNLPAVDLPTSTVQYPVSFIVDQRTSTSNVPYGTNGRPW